jgi:four helix bundle protein
MSDGSACAHAGRVAGVRRFEDLAAWQRAVEVQALAEALCGRAPVARDFKFRDQLADAAASAPRNIAEGFGRFRHADFARFVRIGRASLQEVLNHFRHALRRGYMSPDEFPAYELACKRALKATSGLLRYLDTSPDK